MALSARAVIVATPAPTAVMSPLWSTVATVALLVLHVAVFDVTSSPFELSSRALAVMLSVTRSVDDGAVTTIAVTVVGEGSEGPSPHARATKHANATETAFFMTTLPTRKGRGRSAVASMCTRA